MDVTVGQTVQETHFPFVVDGLFDLLCITVADIFIGTATAGILAMTAGAGGNVALHAVYGERVQIISDFLNLIVAKHTL